VILMNSIKLILLATAVLAVASLTVGTTIQAQAKTILNTHSHSNAETLQGNDGSVLNTDNPDIGGPFHSNTNDNTHRPYEPLYEGECCADRVRTNTHDIPNKGGNGDKGD
jgi:hypothetical protein